jgi:hypothetical protein
MASHSNLAQTAPSRLDVRTGPRRDWVGEFDEHLQSENIAYLERRPMVSTAKQFICWCEMHCPQQLSAIFTDTRVQWDEDELWTLRERFLRDISPDRDLRHLERARLHRFLNYLSSMTAIDRWNNGLSTMKLV